MLHSDPISQRILVEKANPVFAANCSTEVSYKFI